MNEKIKIINDFIDSLKLKFPSLEGKENKQKRIRLHLRIKKYEKLIEDIKNNPDTELPLQFKNENNNENNENESKKKKRKLPV